MTDYMVDIETLATTHDAAILSIGACSFNLTGGGIIDSFECRITLRSNQEAGRGICPETIEWWLSQSKEAQEALLLEPRMPLRQGLQEFMQFVGMGKHTLWSNGPTFDEDILRHAFEQQGLKFPVHFSGSRCVRTTNALLKSHGIAKPERVGTHHNALSDAIYQAECVMLAFRQPHGLVINNVVQRFPKKKWWHIR